MKAGLTAPTWYAKNDEYRTKNLYFKSYFYYPAKANNQKEASMFNEWGKGRSKSCTNTSKKTQKNSQILLLTLLYDNFRIGRGI